MTFVSRDGRQGHLTCDHPLCIEPPSPRFVYSLGGELPDGWVVSMAHRPGPGSEGHLCPVHATGE
jgi:hypothetical protein